MIKRYTTYINEGFKGDKPQFFNLLDIMNKFPGSITIAEKELQNLVLGEICVWYTKGNQTLKKQVVSEVNISRTSHGGTNFYFNGFSVDPDFSVEIEAKGKGAEEEIDYWIKKLDPNKNGEIVGFPSGEVIYVNRDEMQMLLDFGWVRYEQWMRWRDTDYKNIYFYKDENFHKIKGMLDKDYKKPEKPKKANIDEKEEYEVGDYVVCKGTIGRVNMTDRIGKIIDKIKSPKEKGHAYAIQFLMRFSENLLNGNKMYIRLENIKGIYTGDIQTQIQLAKLQDKQMPPDLEKWMTDYIEESDIDDDYHIKQLFKTPGVTNVVVDRGEGNIKKYDKVDKNAFKEGDEVFLSNKTDALYQEHSGVGEFVNVWFPEGKELGKIVDIKIIKNQPCVKTNRLNAWYKMSCVRK